MTCKGRLSLPGWAVHEYRSQLCMPRGLTFSIMGEVQEAAMSVGAKVLRRTGYTSFPSIRTHVVLDPPRRYYSRVLECEMDSTAPMRAESACRRRSETCFGGTMFLWIASLLHRSFSLGRSISRTWCPSPHAVYKQSASVSPPTAAIAPQVGFLGVFMRHRLGIRSKSCK